MKKLLLLLAFPFLGNAQITINTLAGVVAAQQEEGSTYRNYNAISYSPQLNQEPAGFDQTWTISNVTTLGTKSYVNTATITNDAATFPGSSMTQTALIPGSPTMTERTFFNNLGEMTGYINPEYTIYYSGSTASYGSFPLTYGDLTADVVSGSYHYDEYDGSFEGMFITEVDAYGTMTLDPVLGYSTPLAVTRLKTVENLQLSYPGFGVVGTYLRTTYRYYTQTVNNSVWPAFVSTRTQIDIPILGIDSDISMNEVASATLLSTETPAVSVASVVVAPNPVGSQLSIFTKEKVHSIRITDITGRNVLTKENVSVVDVNDLSSGNYLVTVNTDKGSVTKKIVKQ